MSNKIKITYDSKWCKRIGKVFEANIKVNIKDYPQNNWRMIEKDIDNKTIDTNVIFQYDLLNEKIFSSGILSIYLKGENKSPRRYFELLLDDDRSDFTPFVILEDDNFMWEDEKSYKIKTPVCTYIYHKNCGGFASIIDNHGNDWITYHNYGGSDGKFRGVPNLVFTSVGGTLHPGSIGCKSKIVHNGPIKISIISISKEWGFKVRWDIYPEYATMTVIECSINYWFLYEGTPGGDFDEDNDYIVLANGEIKSAKETWHGYGVPWLIFGDSKTDMGLFLLRHTDLPDIEDSYWPMEKNMTVWGFGRAKKREALASYFEKANLKITIGLVKDAKSQKAIDKINSCKMDDRVLIDL